MPLHDPATVLAIATAVFSGINVYLTLRLRLAMLELEKRILREVAGEYQKKELCESKMAALREHVDAVAGN